MAKGKIVKKIVKRAKKVLPGHRGDNRNHPEEYKQRNLGGKEEVAKRVARNKAHREENPPPGHEVDHIDADPLNNKKSNRRTVTAEENNSKGPMTLAEYRNAIAKKLTAQYKL